MGRVEYDIIFMKNISLECKTHFLHPDKIDFSHLTFKLFN